MKYSKKYIWYLFVVSLPFVLFLLFMLISTVLDSEEGEELFSNNFLGINSSGELLLALSIIFVVYCIVSFLICYLSWLKISYSINENDITLEKGILFRKKIIVPYEKMHAVTIERNLIARFFGLSKLAIDSGNTTNSGVDEIIIFDIKNIIIQTEKDLKEKLLLFKKKKIKNDLANIKNNRLDDDSDIELPYKFDKKLRTKMMTCSLGMYIFGIILFMVYIFTMVAFVIINGFNLGYFFIGLLIYFIIICLMILVGKLYFLIKYYDYKIIINDDNIVVSYGYFNLKQFVLSKNRIKGMIVKQDIVQKKKGFATICVELIGLCKTDNNGEVKMNKVLPFIPYEMVDKYLKEFDDRYKVKEITNFSRKNSLRYYVSITLIITFVLIFPFILGFITSYVSLIILLSYIVFSGLVLLLARLKYKNQGIDYDEKNVYFSNGIFVKKYFILPWKSIINIGTFTTPWRSKKGIVSIYIDYYGSKFTSKETVAMIDQKYYAEFLLRYESVK